MNNCKSAGTSTCAPSCLLHLDLGYQLALSGIPKRHQRLVATHLPPTYYARDVFKKIGVTIADKIASGWGAYLYSTTTGTGKTDTACAIAISYIIERLKADYRAGLITPQLVKFAHVPTLLDDLKRGFNDDDAARESAGTLEQLAKVPLVIMDDLGAERPTEWARERLLTVINDRYDNMRSTVYTSNCSLQEIEVTLGARIRSRVEGASVPLEFKGQDWRRRI